MQDIREKKIGIWGLGVFGKSLADFLTTQKISFSLYDSKKILSATDEQAMQWNVRVYPADTLENFLTDNEYIFPSSGIDLRPFDRYRKKFISELDFFYAQWNKRVIGITGTVGKTTVTSILGKLFTLIDRKISVGGNIGIGLPDLLLKQEQSEGAVLELSSFQLELSTQGAPDIAVITNIYPNHLDRHGTLENYYNSKLRMLELQSNAQRALLPLELSSVLNTPQLSGRQYHFFVDRLLDMADYAVIAPGSCVYYCNELGIVYKFINGLHMKITDDSLPTTSFRVNWLIVAAVLDLMGISTDCISEYGPLIVPPEHRLVCIGQHNELSFYNDSKATVPQAMLAAVKKLHGHSIILFLGGVSKGIDRQSSIGVLSGLVRFVICFGKESQELAQMCRAANIDAEAYWTLEEAFAACVMHVQRPNDHILFSPAGASYDLFDNYIQRGECFTKLVDEYVRGK